jgi:hypothetical protein
MWVALLLQSGRTIRFIPGPANIQIPSIANMTPDAMQVGASASSANADARISSACVRKFGCPLFLADIRGRAAAASSSYFLTGPVTS